MLINYRQQRIAPLVAFLLVVPPLLIFLPIWADRHFSSPHAPHLVRVLGPAVMVLFYSFLIIRTASFNARVRRDPRALQWDSLGLGLWQDGRNERVHWAQVEDVSVRQPTRRNYPPVLNISTKAADGSLRRWRFVSSRLQLGGQSLSDVAEQVERARTGDTAPVTAAPRTIGPRLSNPDYERRAATAQIIVIGFTAAYFVSLFWMILHLSSNTMLLTPHDPLLWNSAKLAFLMSTAAVLLLFLKTVSGVGRVSWRVALWFLIWRVAIPGLTFSAMMGLWAWLAANVYVTDKTWGGHVEHGAVLMMINEPWITHRRHVNVEAHLIDRPGQDVFFALDDADGELLKHWHDPGYIDEPACITVPVQWAGYAIRSEVTTDTLLPKGSVSTCK